MSDDQEKPAGLVPPRSEKAVALEIAGEIHAKASVDAEVMGDLRHRLDFLVSAKATEPTRANMIALLRTIAEGLGPAMARPTRSTPPENPVFADHPAITLLIELIDALVDLDKGKAQGALEPSSAGATASLTEKERKWEEAIYVAVIAAQEKFGWSRAKAADFVAEKMRKKTLSRGREPTKARIKAICNKFAKRGQSK